MPEHRLTTGTRYLRHGKVYRIDECMPDGHVLVHDITSGERAAVRRVELVGWLFDGTLELLTHTGSQDALGDRIGRTQVPDLTALADEDPRRHEVVRRLKYVTAVYEAGARSWTRAQLEPVIEVVSAKIEDPRPPYWTTLYRWLRDYEAAGRDARALVPATKARGNRRRKTSGHKVERFGDDDYEKARVVDALAEEAIRTRYLSRARLSVRSVHEHLRGEILAENRHRDAHDHLPVPHLSSLHRKVASLDPCDVATARHGARYAKEAYGATSRGPRPARPLERAECDHTRLDLMVVDPQTRLPLGRPWLTTMLDTYSKIVLGIYLGFHSPSYLSVMRCLRHAIGPKEYLAKRYPAIEHDWPALGVPELLVVDNGKEFYSRHFEDACLQLGIEIDYAPPRCGAYKGAIERWFGTQNTRLLHELPGTTFSDIFDRGDYDPVKHALISLDALVELVHIWIVDVYHQTAHRGIRDLPHRRWTEAVATSPPRLPRRIEELDVLTGCLAQRRIGRGGIELFTLHYNSPELALLRRLLANGEKVRLKYDPSDISRIHVLDPSKNAFIAVLALDQDYTRGLSLWQHDVIRRYARRQLTEQVDVPALTRARQQIEELVARERVLGRSLVGRQRIARYLDLGQPDYRSTSSTNPEAAHPVSQPRTPATVASEESVTRSAVACELPAADESAWRVSYALPRSEEDR